MVVQKSWKKRALRRIGKHARRTGKWAVSAVGHGLRTALKTRMRNGGSRTITTHRKKKRGNLGSGGENNTRSLLVRNKTAYKMPKMIKKAIAPRYVSSITSGRLAVTQGLQNAVMVPLNFNGISNQPAIFNSVHWATLFENLASDQPVDPATAPPANLTRRLYLESAKVSMKIKSAATGEQTVTIYDIVNRRDEATGNTPLTRWQFGITDVTPVIPGDVITTFDYPGSTPFRSEKFCQFYKVDKVTKFTLAAGATHVHNIHLKFNRVYNEEWVTQSAQQAGNTRWVMVVLQGPVVQESGATNVSIWNGELDFVTELTTKFRSVQVNRCVYSRYSGLPTIVTAAIVNEDEDVILPPATI